MSVGRSKPIKNGVKAAACPNCDCFIRKNFQFGGGDNLCCAGGFYKATKDMHLTFGKQYHCSNKPKQTG